MDPTRRFGIMPTWFGPGPSNVIASDLLAKETWPGLIGKIMSYVDVDSIGHITKVSKLWHRESQSSGFWKPFALKILSKCSTTEVIPKSEFKKVVVFHQELIRKLKEVSKTYPFMERLNILSLDKGILQLTGKNENQYKFHQISKKTLFELSITNCNRRKKWNEIMIKIVNAIIQNMHLYQVMFSLDKGAVEAWKMRQQDSKQEIKVWKDKYGILEIIFFAVMPPDLQCFINFSHGETAELWNDMKVLLFPTESRIYQLADALMGVIMSMNFEKTTDLGQKVAMTMTYNGELKNNFYQMILDMSANETEVSYAINICYNKLIDMKMDSFWPYILKGVIPELFSNQSGENSVIESSEMQNPYKPG